jgi:mono/diheme cytochrome c family protein
MNLLRTFQRGSLSIAPAPAPAWALVALLLAGWCSATARCRAADAVDFNRDIRPILSDNCFRCHGPASSSREADLRFDREDSAKAARDGKPAIVPGKPEASELVHRITNEDESERMPPVDSGKTLTPKQIELLTRWIKQGAVWSVPWAYVAPKRHPIPEVKDRSWPLNWVDNFLLARLEREGLKPSPEADATTLVRRLYIDLVGLPPRPEEVDAFMADKRPDAYERLVDRLLASPHYGERMAIYWLDLVRYADTVGYHGDQEQHISPYRDYVIQAFNRNLPFDQFTREQLAGDLLPDPTLTQKIATGYNRVLQTSHEGGVQAKEYLAIYAADHVRNFSVVWMGATMGCAQCHDHKYDPYTSKDFYSMEAFFADIDEARHLGHGVDRSPTVREPEMELLTPRETTQLARLNDELKQLKAQSAAAAVAKTATTATDASLAEPAPDPAVKTIPSPSDVSPPSAKAAGPTAKTIDAAKPKAAAADDDPYKKQIGKIEARIKSIHDNALRTMITVAIKPRTIRILPRGNWMDDSGAIVQPAIPEFLGKLPTGDRRATRLDLANWLTDADRGTGRLTARVMANRLWYLLFGAGIVRTLDDFGGQGEAPVHPELLDNLSMEFADGGWDIKHLLKLLVTSRAYRQSSIDTPEMRQRDPLNRLVAHQSRFRFPAEVVRDTALSISGLLVDKIGGPSVHPYQPAGYYRHLNFPIREYHQDNDSRQWRRGVYVHWQRQFLHPMLKAFDAPSREECTAQRPRSNTAPAALVMLNDPTFVEASRVFAAKILSQGGATLEERMAYAFRQAESRQPAPDEASELNGLLAASMKYYSKQPKAAEKLLAVGLTPRPADADPVELASWTIVARAILNMNDTITRN